MTLALAFLLLLVTVPVAGGRLSRLESLQIRGLWFAAAAFAIQVVLVTLVPEGNETLHRIAHLATYGLVGACILRNLDITSAHRALDDDGAFNGIHDAWKFHQDSIARQLDDPALPRRDFRLYQLRLMRLKRAQRANLIGPHQAAVADDVGGEDCGKATFNHGLVPAT